METVVPVRTEVNGKTRYKYPKKDQLEAASKEYQGYIDNAKKELELRGLPFGSPYNMMLVTMQVAARFPEHLNEAIPYLTVKTFQEWKKVGRKVRKGEKAMQIVVWMNPRVQNTETGDYEYDTENTYPKTTYIFGIWQTDPVE